MSMSTHLVPYLTAAASSLAALALRLAMHPILQEAIPYETFYVAVLLSSLYGGAGPGVVALVLGGLAALLFVVPPEGLAIQGADNQLAFGLYVLVSGAIVRMAELQRRGRVRAETLFRLALEQ